MDNTLIEVGTDGEVRRVKMLIEKIWPDHYTPIIGRAQVEYMMAGYQSDAEIKSQIASGCRYYILSCNGVDAGYMAYEVKPEGMYLSKLYVMERERRKGLGRFMAGFIEDEARKIGIKRVFLRVNKFNISSIKAYEKMGYIKTAEMKEDIGGGFVMDDYVMEKRV
ncbi:MAG: GNAT family N-acetyltransferase [Spirochaetia bacterium]|nr:GNAT family N-acetyltransferase [Spirochaetia bacterium]